MGERGWRVLVGAAVPRHSQELLTTGDQYTTALSQRGADRTNPSDSASRAPKEHRNCHFPGQ